jgi:glycosyltransferase involved in cell wall biosynthesis
MTPVLSVVICTWNRAAMLVGALKALLRQDDPPPHEILVVDNGSPDDTAARVRALAARHPHLRYLMEPRHGLAHARNAGLRAARGELVAFTDDDVRVAPDWMARAADACARWPDAACVGGPVVPHWERSVPAWLTTSQWAPLGLQDYGADPFRVDTSRPICLIGANLTIRASVFERVGEFDPMVQRVGDRGGSTEDHELHLRLWSAGLHGMYDPAVRATAIVIPQRLRKAHHRAWHFGHGRHIARMRIPTMEQTRTGRVLGVPAHLFRQAAADACDWLRLASKGDTARAFEREARLCFIAGFVRERWV